MRQVNALLKPEVIAAIANLGKIAALQSEIAPATRAMSEIAKQLASYKIDIPPAITELQQRLSEIDFSMLPDSNNTQQEDEEKNLMNHMKFESPDLTAQNIDRIAALFPNCITEMLDEEHSTPEKRGVQAGGQF